uniref:Si:ch211-120k19.1 n=1 Tax=Sphaeramia orbicularis TaxID=375764 RepID=A0A673BHS8_9TELE
MNRAWAVFKAHPYIGNVLGYTTLFASADLIQQSLLGGNAVGIDWCQTGRVATVGFCFHANFNYHWLRALERMLPGSRVRMVTAKVVLDQLIAAPLTISAFYIGSQIDVILFQIQLVYWSTMQVRILSIFWLHKGHISCTCRGV